jgi:hypothetical protein
LIVHCRFFSELLGGSASVKFFSETIAANILADSIESTDLNKCFQKGGVPTLPTEHTAYKQHLEKNPIQGSLRIHITIPKASKSAATTRVEGNDVLVFITLENLDEFFYERFTDPTKNNNAKHVKDLIRYGVLSVLNIFV